MAAPKPKRPVHYSAAGRAMACPAGREWHARNRWPIGQLNPPPRNPADPQPLSTTDVSRVTCPSCQKYIADWVRYWRLS